MTDAAGGATGHTVRSVRVADASAVAHLATQLGYPSRPEPMRARLALLARRADHRVCVAVSGEGTLCGWIHVARCIALEEGEYAEILGLVVDAHARRSGAGRGLVAAAEDWCRERGLERVVVRSNVVRIESHLFYPSVGYTRLKSQHVYVRTLTAGG